MSTKRVTVTLDAEVETWLTADPHSRYSLSEMIRICLREYMAEKPQRFVSPETLRAQPATPEYKGGLDTEITDSWTSADLAGAESRPEKSRG